MDFSNYKFRCSALGNIMSARGEITQSNATYLTDLFIGETYGIRKEVTTKFFEKGNYMEEDAITLLNKTIYPGKLLVKNKERKANEYIHGEADCIAPDGIIYDCKNAWDRFSFGKADLTTTYYWQLIGYLWLWGLKKARLFYCLNNMPEHLLADEERKLFYQNHFISYEDEQFQTLCLELRAKHNYDTLPLWERFKVWDVELLEGEIERLKTKIDKCRIFLQELDTDHADTISYNKKLMGIATVMVADYDKEVDAVMVEGDEINLSKLKKL